MPKLKISHRLIGGFACMIVLLCIAVGLTVWQVGSVKKDTDRIVDLRVPTAQASAAMTNNINASLAALRGWMLTGNQVFKVDRAVVWKNIAETTAAMDVLSESWTNPENVEKWSEFKKILGEFSAAQDKVEAIANTKDEQPATRMLVEDAAPLATVMVKAITKMINLELDNSNGSGDRVQLLGMMADVRGTLGLSLANIRAYLLTGENKFVANFKKLWAKNNRRFKDLSNATYMMSSAQKAAFGEFSKKRTVFAAMPAKMFAIRGSKKWNMANYTLVSEAAPRAGKLLTALTGPKQADGSRIGGMMTNQRNLLNNDAANSAKLIGELLTMQWMLLGLGIAVGTAVAFLTLRSISPPIIGMTAAMGQLAEGDLDTEVPAQDRSDELGEMSKAVQVFKENAIRNKELEAGQEEQKRRAEEEKRVAINELADDFENSVGGIVETVSAAATEMQTTAQAMSSIAEETSNQAIAVASASEEASTNVQTVASSTEEMTASVSEINQRVSEASAASKTAVTEVAKTSEQMSALAQTA